VAGYIPRWFTCPKTGQYPATHARHATQRTCGFFDARYTQATQEKYATKATDASDATAKTQVGYIEAVSIVALRFMRSLRCVRRMCVKSDGVADVVVTAAWLLLLLLLQCYDVLR